MSPLKGLVVDKNVRAINITPLTGLRAAYCSSPSVIELPGEGWRRRRRREVI